MKELRLGFIGTSNRGLGLVKTASDGSMALVDKSISTPSEVLSMAVVTYHGDIITLGRESIERFAPSQRDIRSVTLGLSSKGTEVLKKRMEAFWKELLAFAESEKGTEKVMQVNMQLFPVALEKGKEK